MPRVAAVDGVAGVAGVDGVAAVDGAVCWPFVVILHALAMVRLALARLANRLPHLAAVSLANATYRLRCPSDSFTYAQCVCEFAICV